MKKTSLILIAGLVLIAGSTAVSAEVKDFSKTISIFKDSPVVQKFFKNSYGFAVFPTVGKGGWVVGGSYGKGQVYRGGKVTGKTSLIEGSIGFQFGGKAFSQIIFFQNKAAYEKFTSGNFEFDTTAQATVITAAAEAQGGTTGVTAGATAGPKTGVQAEAQYYDGMAVFIHSKGGLMVEVSIGGQKFTFKPI